MALAALRERYRPLLRACLEELSVEQLLALRDAVGALAGLVDALQREGAR